MSVEKPKPLETSLTKLLNLDYPIIGAPMFLISDTNLVVTTCEAGASGSFPALNFRPLENFKSAIQEIKKRTSKAFGVNLIVQSSNKYFEEQFQTCLDEQVPYIITSLGNPQRVIPRAKERGVLVFCDVTNMTHAQRAVDAGADGLIAVASGAGGHAGNISPFALIPSLKQKFKIPVVAAGSIVDGKTLLAAMALGADGVYMGTRLIASKEADAPSEYKQAILKYSSEDIISTDRIDGFPGNFIKTPELKKLLDSGRIVQKLLNLNAKAKRLQSLSRAAKTLFGNPDRFKASYKTIFSAGHGIGQIDNILSVEEIIYNSVFEFHKQLSVMMESQKK